ncbi:hypothetical protein [Undibacterium sp. Ji22W]|uniref:hypothetical protein n=1 Tax=Undibacterium sp. Ji22W TaxID=3413038 RepID=UPI003BF39C28
MRKIVLFIASLLLPFALANAQSNIKLSATDTVDNEDLMNVLRFQGIAVSKIKFTGTHLWGKNFKIFIRDFAKGKLIKTYEVFDSKEDEFFKIKEQEFSFSVLAQRTYAGTAKIDLRFLGFGVVKEFNLGIHQKDFILKSFQESSSEIDFPVGQSQSILIFMMPTKSTNGSTPYTDVTQSNFKPEELGKKSKIPRYFLIDVRFD